MTPGIIALLRLFPARAVFLAEPLIITSGELVADPRQ